MVYCINCDKKVNYIVKERIVDLFIWNLSVRENIIRDIIKDWPTCVEKYAVCENYGEEIYVSKINDWNVKERLLKRIKIGDLAYKPGSEEDRLLKETLGKLERKLDKEWNNEWKIAWTNVELSDVKRIDEKTNKESEIDENVSARESINN